MIISLDGMKAAKNALCKLFRCNNSRIPKVVGRYREIPREQCFAKLCAHNEAKLGDEFHIVLECSHPDIVRLREKYIHRSYFIHPNRYRFFDLLSCKNKRTIRSLGLFLSRVLGYYR